MLQAIREKITGWIAYGIIFLISIPFALWGVNSYLGHGEAPPAAIINGDEISMQVLDQAYANYRQRMVQLFGGSIPESLGSEAGLRDQVLNQLIEEFALRQYIEKQGYRIGDEALNRLIREMDVFKTDGRFDSAIYERQLRSQGYSPLGFEQELRTSGAMEQFQAGIRATSFTLPVAKENYNRLANQTRKLRSISYSTGSDKVTVSDDEIVAQYESQASRYNVPEQVKIDYIELSLDNIKNTIEVKPEQVLARYEDNITAYTTPEVREASHILIKVDDATSSDQAELRINQIRDRLENGESFAALARELSEDPGSANDGGSLGEIERGVMVQSFEATLFSMQVGQLSEPVKTGFGWHLIQLHAVSGGEVQPFASLQAQFEDEIKSELAESQIYDLVENLANLAYEESHSLEPAAEQLGLTIQTSDWFGRSGGEGIATEEKVKNAAFSADVLQQGRNSEAIELGTERVVFIRLNQHKPAAPQPLDLVREQIRMELQAKKRRAQNRAAGEQALSALGAGGTLEDLAQQWATSVTDFGFIERQQSGIDPAIRNTAFVMPKPEAGPEYEGLTLANGDYAIIELAAISTAETEIDQKALETLTDTRAEGEYRAALKLITTRAEVVRTPLEEY